jgi:hypothetical protein
MDGKLFLCHVGRDFFAIYEKIGIFAASPYVLPPI